MYSAAASTSRPLRGSVHQSLGMFDVELIVEEHRVHVVDAHRAFVRSTDATLKENVSLADRFREIAKRREHVAHGIGECVGAATSVARMLRAGNAGPGNSQE